MEFSLIGQLDRTKDEIKIQIEKLGGRLTSSVHDKMAAVISNESEVEKMNQKMEKAKSLGIQVVPLKFLDEVKNGNALKLIKTQSLCDWGTDVSVLLINVISSNDFNYDHIFIADDQNSSRRGDIQVEEYVYQI